MSILIVGGGKMGLSHIAILNRLLDKGQVALCDPSWLARSMFGKLQITTFRSLDKALQHPRQWRGAIVATPTPSHFAISKSLLERSIPCFIEKPLTLNPAQSEVLADLQSRSGTIAQMGFVTRFIQPFVRLRRIAKTGLLGAPLNYHARMLGNVVTKSSSYGWRTDFSRGGGCLNEYGPHLLDLCRFIFGDIKVLQSASFGRVHSRHADDNDKISWKHASGAQADLLLDWCDSSRRKSSIDFEVDFEQGIVRANNAGLNIQAKERVAFDSILHGELTDSLPYPVNFYLRGEEYSLQLEVFLERVLGKKLLRADIGHDLAASIADGLEVDRLIKDIAAIGHLA
jgi:scyllo-inositol 2-dehydrogenase (NADP+)